MFWGFYIYKSQYNFYKLYHFYISDEQGKTVRLVIPLKRKSWVTWNVASWFFCAVQVIVDGKLEHWHMAPQDIDKIEAALEAGKGKRTWITFKKIQGRFGTAYDLEEVLTE